jgi:glutamine amidotransferase
MRMSRIVVIDYRMGNLRSVAKALEAVGAAEVVVSSDPGEVAAADRLVVPGVGAFADAMGHLREARLVDPILQFLQTGRPFLGICLGLHMLFERSFEDGTHEGLGVMEGQVVRFQAEAGAERGPLKVPHIGWNQVRKQGDVPMLAGVPDGAYFYFVHSYYVVPADPRVVAATTEYGVPFCSAVSAGRLFATQFHPEKSQAVGLQVLRNFVNL